MLVSVQRNCARSFSMSIFNHTDLLAPLGGGLCAVRRKMFERIPISSCIPRCHSAWNIQKKLCCRQKQSKQQIKQSLASLAYAWMLVLSVYCLQCRTGICSACAPLFSKNKPRTRTIDTEMDPEGAIEPSGSLFRTNKDMPFPLSLMIWRDLPCFFSLCCSFTLLPFHGLFVSFTLCIIIFSGHGNYALTPHQ